MLLFALLLTLPPSELHSFYLQRTPAAASLTQKGSTMAGSDLDCTAFPPSVMAPSPSASSQDLSLGGTTSTLPVQEHMHSAASEAQALAQEAAQLKAQAQSYQASQCAHPGIFLCLNSLTSEQHRQQSAMS